MSAGRQVSSESPVAQLDSKLGLQILASSPDCVKLLDREGKVRFVSKNGLLLLEIDDASQLIGRDLWELWPEAAHARIKNAICEALAGKVSRFAEFCATPKGSSKWWDASISPIYGNDGAVAWLLFVSRDITKHNATESALRVSEERFRALADNIAQFAWMADPSGYIFWYNQRWFDYTGTTIGEMRGWGWQKVHHPDHVERVVNHIRECFERGEIWEDTFPLRGADGNYRWFLSRAMPIRDDSGKVTLWCGTNTDVTDQRNQSLRLRQLARLIELSYEAISVRSLTSGIMLWNRGCEELYGYSQSEAMGRDSHELLKSDNMLPRAELERLLLTEGTWSGEIGRIAKDGRRVWVECRKQVIRVGDESVVLESDRDITERRKADEVRNLLIGELNHRVKNTLAIVQSLATQTARSVTSTSDFVSRFNGRLQSLSNAHNVLTDQNWSGANLRELIQSQTSILTLSECRVVLSGPDVFLPPQSALQITLILHELATNAIKHGALSSHAGKISLSWHLSSGPPTTVVLLWKEIGGPPVVEPETRGFGLSLVERSGRLHNISADIAFLPDGVECRMVARLDEPRAGESSFFDPSTGRSVRA